MDQGEIQPRPGQSIFEPPPAKVQRFAEPLEERSGWGEWVWLSSEPALILEKLLLRLGLKPESIPSPSLGAWSAPALTSPLQGTPLPGFETLMS